MKRDSLTVRIEGEWDVTRLNPEMSRVFCRTLLATMLKEKEQQKGDSRDVASITCEDKTQIAN